MTYESAKFTELSIKLEQLEKQHAKLTAELEAERQALASLTEEQQLAILLHDKTCTANHIDQCSWTYEFEKGQHQWHSGDHQRYLAKAIKLQHKCKQEDISPAKALELFSFIKNA